LACVTTFAPIWASFSRTVRFWLRIDRGSANYRRGFTKLYDSPVAWIANALARAVDTLHKLEQLEITSQASNVRVPGQRFWNRLAYPLRDCLLVAAGVGGRLRHGLEARLCVNMMIQTAGILGIFDFGPGNDERAAPPPQGGMRPAVLLQPRRESLLPFDGPPSVPFGNPDERAASAPTTEVNTPG
jgi:hypothetical protein